MDMHMIENWSNNDGLDCMMFHGIYEFHVIIFKQRTFHNLRYNALYSITPLHTLALVDVTDELEDVTNLAFDIVNGVITSVRAVHRLMLLC